MNPKVEQWLQAQKAAQAASKRANREKHLIEIGLCSEENSLYMDGAGNTLTKEQYDSFKAIGRPAYARQGALDVTDEEYAEICKYAPENNITNNVADGVSNRAERGIVKFANVVKTIGVILWIILALIGLIGGLVVAEASWSFPVGLFIAYFFGGVFSGFICWLGCYLTWAVLKVFTNISNTLYRLEAKRE